MTQIGKSCVWETCYVTGTAPDSQFCSTPSCTNARDDSGQRLVSFSSHSCCSRRACKQASFSPPDGVWHCRLAPMALLGPSCDTELRFCLRGDAAGARDVFLLTGSRAWGDGCPVCDGLCGVIRVNCKDLHTLGRCDGCVYSLVPHA